MTQHGEKDDSAAPDVLLGPWGKDVQTFSELKIGTVPPNFVRGVEEQETITPHDYFGENVPVIDLAGLQDADCRESTMAAVADACQNWGFFQGEEFKKYFIGFDHRPSTTAYHLSTFKLAREFFDLPQEEKMAHARDMSKPVSNGYGRSFHTSANMTQDWHDAFFHYIYPLSMRNMDTWPRKPAAYRETMDKYGEEVLKLTDRLLDIFGELLGLKPGYLKDVFGIMLNTRLNFYPACPEPKRVFGLRPHSDPNVMTVLAQDEVGGLQVKKGNRWVGVPPLPGALVVNLGDSVQIVSNDRFQSVEHRVITNQSVARLSLPVFRHPLTDAQIRPAHELVDESHPALYPTTNYATYMLAFRKKELGKYLSKNEE